MIKTLTGIIVLFLVISCKNDDALSVNTIEGEWKLIAVLADPGDGSGEFRSVSSNKTVRFNANGSYTSNGKICDFSSLADDESEGIYVATDQGYSIECEGQFVYPVNLQLKDGFLIITFFCIEPCQHKYKKVG